MAFMAPAGTGAVTTGKAATKQVKGAGVIFEATISEVSAGKSTGEGGLSVGGLQLSGGSASDGLGIDVRVLDASGAGDAWSLAAAMLWAVDPDGNPATDDGAHILNLSLAGSLRTRLLDNVALLAGCLAPDPTVPGDAIERSPHESTSPIPRQSFRAARSSRCR